MNDIKFIFEDDTTLSEFTVEANDYHSGVTVIPMIAAEDRIYIGSYFPFNHMYFKFGTVNDAASVLSIDVWANSTWRPVVEVLDETALSGSTFGQDGYVSWVPNRNNGWQRDDTVTSSGSETITGLGGVTIYDRYWARLSVSADLNSLSSVSWAGTLFSNDNDLGAEFPDLTRSTVLSAWEAGKTSWEEQHVKAAEVITDDLRERRVIIDKSQILERKDFRLASVSKVAEIAFRGMGPDFLDDRNDARSIYEKRVTKNTANIDRDRDGQKDREELQQLQGRLTR